MIFQQLLQQGGTKGRAEWVPHPFKLPDQWFYPAGSWTGQTQGSTHTELIHCAPSVGSLRFQSELARWEEIWYQERLGKKKKGKEKKNIIAKTAIQRTQANVTGGDWEVCKSEIQPQRLLLGFLTECSTDNCSAIKCFCLNFHTTWHSCTVFHILYCLSQLLPK